jgi:hypothetical protein
MRSSYILFKEPDLWTPSRANDIRACSTTLAVAAERNGALRKYCDVLDSLVDAVMHHIEKRSLHQDPSTNTSAGLSAIRSHHTESPERLFSRLGDTFEPLRFEFPTQSYPVYRRRECCPNESSTAFNEISTEGTDSSVFDFTPSIDFALGEPTDGFGTLSGFENAFDGDPLGWGL